jgi:hypothetical protein
LVKTLNFKDILKEVLMLKVFIELTLLQQIKLINKYSETGLDMQKIGFLDPPIKLICSIYQGILAMYIQFILKIYMENHMQDAVLMQ